MARRAVRQHLKGVAGEPALEKAVLVASELATNPYQYGEGEIEMRLQRRGSGRIRIELVDQGSNASVKPREPRPGMIGGWGLHIVEQMAVRWGAFEGTTHVWAELPLA